MIGRTSTRRTRLGRVLAVTLLAVAACLVAVWIAPRASGAAAEWMRTPSVRLHTLTVPGNGGLVVTGPSSRAAAPIVLDAGMRFSMAGVVCDVPGGEGPVTVRLRTSLDGRAWSAWMEAPLEVADDLGEAPEAYIDPVWAGAAQYVQIAASSGGGGAPSRLTGVRLVAIDSTEDADVAARAVGVLRRAAAAVAGLAFAPPASAASAAPVIVTRAQWGANESLRNGSPSYASVKMAFVHHTASGNTYTSADAPALVRGIYAYHTRSLGWSDIGYNFLVDRFGTIYEGRYGGITRGVIGAQVLGFNTGSTGISVMGTFTSEAPPTAAVASLERLLAWKLAVHGLDPAGKAQLTCGATEKYKKGATVTFPVIAGHRQANYTECPGSSLYALLPKIRSDVAGRVTAPVVVNLSVDAPLLSPNGDGVRDEVALDVRVNTPADWTLAVRSNSGAAVTSWSGQGTSGHVTWDGRANGGTVAPDGEYTAELAATAAAGEAEPASQTITVDTTAPRLTGASAAPLTFSPNGDRQDETAAVTYSPAEACSVRVGIIDMDGKVLRWLHGWRARQVKAYTVTWDGRISSGGSLVDAPDGLYRFDVERRDEAGNIARLGVKITVDRTIGFPKATPVTISPNGDGRRDTSTVRFTLTRAAAVTATIRLGDVVLRTIDLGPLPAGQQTFVWDGTDSTGTSLGSSRPVATLAAASSVGDSAVVRGFVVDRYRPRMYATRGRATAPGKTVKMYVKIVDPFSAKVDLRYKIVDTRGRRVASAHPGYVRTGNPVAVRWKPKKRGRYTVVYRATDLGGNRETRPARTTVTVR